MNLNSDSELCEEVDRALRRRGETPLAPDEASDLRDYLHAEELHAPYGSGDLKVAVTYIREERGTEKPPARRRERIYGLVARAMRECEERAALPHVQEAIEKWRREVFGSAEPPFDASGPVSFARVADWIEAEWRTYPDPGAGARDLDYPGRRAPASIRIAPWTGGDDPPNPLQRLLMTARTVAHAIGCPQEDAVAFAATGIVPLVPPAVVERDRTTRLRLGSRDDGPTVITVNYDWVPADIVRDLYQSVRPHDARLERTKAAGAKMRVLREFLQERPDMRWADLHDEWNRTHPEWAYDKLNSFREVGRRQQQRQAGGK